MTFQTFTGREYLKIDIANNFGLDKLNWADRIAWFDANENRLDEMIPAAKEPALFYAGVKAWRAVLAGQPIGYMISLDATSSGLQLLAALTGDPYAAALCNVIDTGNREDAYVALYQHMLSLVQDKSKLSRDDTKQAIMTAFYSSKAVPKKVFGEGPLLDIFYGTLQTCAPGAWELNEAMLAFWNPTALEHSWVLPDNFHVHIKVMDQVRERVHFINEPFDVFYKVNRPMDEGRSLGANTIHSIDGMIVRELTRRCDYNPKQIDRIRELIGKGSFGSPTDSPANSKMVHTLWEHYLRTGYLSARILDYLDENSFLLANPTTIKELLDSLPQRPFKVISIHDCFRVLPHYGNDLRQQYNLQLQFIARSTLLQDILAQLVGRPIQINKIDPNLWQQVGQTNYALS
jgi:hypothetical protein